MGRADACEAPGLGLDHGPEGVASQRALLLQVDADCCEVVIGQDFPEQLSVGVRSLFCRRRQPDVGGVGCEPRRIAKAAMAGRAGPGIARRVVRHACAHRVEIDVAVAAQDVGLGVHEAGFISPFPQGACATMIRVELADVATSELLHHR